jgi:hypothetical protein
MINPKLIKILSLCVIVLGILLLFLGIYIDLTVLPIIYGVQAWLYIFNILPGTLLIYTSLNLQAVRRLRKRSKVLVWCFIGLLSVSLIPLNCIIGVGLSAKNVTNPDEYENILRFIGYGDHKYLNHLPPEIPKNAGNTSLFWSKGFLQSNWFLQLRFTIPRTELEIFLSENRAKKVEMPSFYLSRPHLIKPLYAGEKNWPDTWPPDFEIIVFNYAPQPNPDDEGYETREYWEKRFSWGVAASPKRSEVVYWTQEYPYQ